jgi:predicted transcriptional regulator
MKSIKRSINIPDDLYLKLQEMAKDKGITIASLIKLACSEFVKREKKNG